jgi:MFS family permease
MAQKSDSYLRWVILFLTCILMIGNYYCYDIPAAMKTQLDDYMGNPSNFETYFSLLYTLYSIPNIILPFFGGFFVDKVGVRLCLIIFVVLIAAGQVVFAFGVSIKSWPVMFIGRIIYGFGGESISVANSSILADWFVNKEVAFAFGLNLSVARLGSVFNNLLSPILADSAGVPFALWFGTILCASSVGCALLMAPIDKAMEVKLGIQPPEVCFPPPLPLPRLPHQRS